MIEKNKRKYLTLTLLKVVSLATLVTCTCSINDEEACKQR